MNNQYGQTQDEATVAGFEVPRSPDASYNNVYPGNEDVGREPPIVPQHLHHTLLNYSTSRDVPGSLPVPQNVIINHLYLENREAPRSVVALESLIASAQSMLLLCSTNQFKGQEVPVIE